MVASSVYFLESILCWIPSIVSFLMVWKNDIVQAVLNICYPTSQLYIGKKIHVPIGEASHYIFYWLTLIAFKLWFGYKYIVNPVAAPSLELYDDYMNFGELPFYKTALIMFVWWFPHFLVYCIDLSIWYSCWSSVVGGFIALVERQGAVRDSTSFRAHFMRLVDLYLYYYSCCISIIFLCMCCTYVYMYAHFMRLVYVYLFFYS